jgi:hypothetical protein
MENEFIHREFLMDEETEDTDTDMFLADGEEEDDEDAMDDEGEETSDDEKEDEEEIGGGSK